MEGNKRFQENNLDHPHQTFYDIKELQTAQHPFAVILGCSDSRVPPELIFDQGFGDLFVIRNAGNIVSDYTIGSIEYAVEHLGTELVVVLGHKDCGAIGAFIEHKKDDVHSHIQNIIDYVADEFEQENLDKNSPSYYDKAVLANINHGVHVIKNSEPVLKPTRLENKVKIVGMIYDMETGEVDLLHE